MSRIVKLALVAVLFGMVGCASTKQYVALPDQAKEIENPEKARIYVVRPETIGAAISMEVRNDGDLIGKTGPKGYLSWEREPGKTTITSNAENTSSLELDLQKGMVYYVWQEVKMGIIMARSKLQELSIEKGKKLIGKCKPPQLMSAEQK